MIQAINLTKRYEDGALALDAVNFKVSTGEIYCLLGANGAGKTTTLNVFLSFIEPTSGQALINGIDVARNPLEAKRHIAYIAENVRLYGYFTARQNLEFFAKLSGSGREPKLKKADYYAVLREVGLQEKAFEQKVSSFSKTMLQKLGVAIALIRNASAVLLDEPTSGLDPKGAIEFMELIESLREKNKAILMSTHDLFRVKDIADRIGILQDGRKVIERTREEFNQENLEAFYLNYMRGGYQPEGNLSLVD